MAGLGRYSCGSGCSAVGFPYVLLSMLGSSTYVIAGVVSTRNSYVMADSRTLNLCTRIPNAYSCALLILDVL